MWRLIKTMTSQSQNTNTYSIKSLLQGDIQSKVFAPWVREWLLFIADMPAISLYTQDNIALSDENYARYYDGLHKMVQGVPLAYLMGFAYFYGHKFWVTKDTLIPRPDSELLVELCLDIVPHASVLELGCGTGCIGLSLACACAVDLTLVDICPKALAITQKNAQALGMRAKFVQSDWFTMVQGRFDCIIANPPYIAHDDSHLTDLQYEPYSALVADDNGLADLAHIIAHAKPFLTSQGRLVLEHGYTQGEQVRNLMAQYGFVGIKSYQDLGNNERATIGFCV